jgi:hypothetical protein
VRKLNDLKLHDLKVDEFEYIISYCKILNISISRKHRQCLYNHSHKDTRKRLTFHNSPRSKAYYQENKQKLSSNHKQRLLDQKSQVIEAYGGKCNCCGETGPKFLSIDHIFNDGSKVRSIEGKGSMVYYYLIKHNFPKERHQLLCMNCNFGKHMNGGICPHKE